MKSKIISKAIINIIFYRCIYHVLLIKLIYSYVRRLNLRQKKVQSLIQITLTVKNFSLKFHQSEKNEIYQQLCIPMLEEEDTFTKQVAKEEKITTKAVG